MKWRPPLNKTHLNKEEVANLISSIYPELDTQNLIKTAQAHGISADPAGNYLVSDVERLVANLVP